MPDLACPGASPGNPGTFVSCAPPSIPSTAMPDPLDELAEAWEHKDAGPWYEADGHIGRPKGAPVIAVLDGSVIQRSEPLSHTVTSPNAHFIALCGTYVGTLIERLRAETERRVAAEAVCEAAVSVIKIGYDDGPEEIALSAALDAWAPTITPSN